MLTLTLKELFPKFPAAKIHAVASLNNRDGFPDGIWGGESSVPAGVKAGVGQGAQGLCLPWEQSCKWNTTNVTRPKITPALHDKAHLLQGT